MTTTDLLRDSVGSALATHCTPELVRIGATEWERLLWNVLRDIGVPWLGISESCGGVGGAPSDVVAVLQLMGRHCAPLYPAEMALMAARVLELAGIRVPDEGPLIMAFDLEGGRLQGRLEGADLRVSGSALRVAWGRSAAAFVVLCEVSESHAVAVLPSSECEIAPGENLAREPRDNITFHHLRVPAGLWALSSIPPQELLAIGAAIRCVAISGAMRRIQELTITHAKNRVQFGKPIATFQEVRRHIAILCGSVVLADTCAQLAARSLENGDRVAAGIAKLVASEACSTGAQAAHQVLGAIGMTREHELHLLTTRLWSWREEYGSEHYWSKVLGRETMVDPAHRMWRSIVPIH